MASTALTPPATTPSRIGHAVVAACAITGLAIQFAIVLGYPADEIPMRAIRMLSFFTILTNGLVAAASIGLAIGSGKLHRWSAKPRVRAAITVYILVVAIIFHLLLSHTVKPGILHHWGNIFCHQVVPTLWVAAWLGFGRHGEIDNRAPIRWLGYPAFFGGWTLIHGAESTWYPYPFMNVLHLGWVFVLRNMLLIGLFFVALGYLIRWIDGRLALWRSARG
jgi:hypothetical protein